MQLNEEMAALFIKAKKLCKKAGKSAERYAKISYMAAVKYGRVACKYGKRYGTLAAKAVNRAYNRATERVILPAFFATVRFFRRTPRAFAALIAVVVLASSTATVALATDATTAYSVMYDGACIATVKDPSVLAEAEILAAGKLGNPDCNPYIIDATLTQTVVSQSALISSDSLSDIIISNSEDIVLVSLLELDGKQVAKAEDAKKLQSALNKYLNDYKNDNKLEAVDFFNEIKVSDVYTLKSTAAKLPGIEKYISGGAKDLVIKNVKTVVETTVLEYETVETKSSAYVEGTRITTQKGVNGTQQITYKVSEVDGKQVEKIKASSKVIKAPVNKKVTVGTKKVTKDENVKVSMLWPVKRVARSYVSSYVGDGRGHKGMDIVAPAGTPIYAARKGVVTYAGWDTSGYGNKVIVKHANGVETLYAHCSVIKVKVGDQVGEGQEIALVGTTGRSTGNHLHFEVHVNGRFVNPSGYIGRK